MDDLVRTACPGGTVTVVGNGPLAAGDHERINASECVFRFNDMKNYAKGDALTVHVSRYDETGRFPGIHKSDPTAVHLLPVAVNQTLVDTYASNRPKVLPMLHVEERGEHNDTADTSVFNDCAACHNGSLRCRHDDAACGPSTGTLVIDRLQAMDSVRRVDVFGMNWNGGAHHVDFAQPAMVETCCDKCDFHPTRTGDYDGRNPLVVLKETVVRRAQRIMAHR